MGALANRINQGGVAGRYGIDKNAYQGYKDIFGEDAGLMYMMDRIDQRRAEYDDPENLKKKLETVLPFYQKIGEQSQKFGLQSNLVGAGIDALRSIPQTVNAFRAIPLQGLYQQANTVPSVFASYGAGRPGFSGVRGRLGGR